MYIFLKHKNTWSEQHNFTACQPLNVFSRSFSRFHFPLSTVKYSGLDFQIKEAFSHHTWCVCKYQEAKAGKSQERPDSTASTPYTTYFTTPTPAWHSDSCPLVQPERPKGPTWPTLRGQQSRERCSNSNMLLWLWPEYQNHISNQRPAATRGFLETKNPTTRT